MRTRSTVLATLVVASAPLVSHAAMAARVPFQRTAASVCGSQFCSLSFSVPAGGRLEMVNVSCQMRTDGIGLADAVLVVRGSGQPLAAESHLPVARLATSADEVVFIANQQKLADIQVRKHLFRLRGAVSPPAP